MKNAVSLCLVCGALAANAYGGLNHYLLLTGGTGGVGAGYAQVWGRFVGKAGAQVQVLYDRDENEYAEWEEASIRLHPFVDAGVLINRDERVRVAGHVSLELQARYDVVSVQYRDSTAISPEEDEGFACSILGISPGVELYLMQEGRPRFSASLGCVRLRPWDWERVSVRGMCSVTYYIRLGREKDSGQDGSDGAEREDEDEEEDE